MAAALRNVSVALGVVMFPRAVLFVHLIVGLTACDGSPTTLVDFQLDILTPLPTNSDAVRICITEGVSERFAAASGHYAVTGLSVDEFQEVVVDVMDSDEQLIFTTAPVLLNVAYSVSYLNDCAVDTCSPCVSSGAVPPKGVQTQTLGVRFWDE